MIIRILGEGQYDVAEERVDELNGLDDALVSAIDNNDTAGFGRALSTLIAAVRHLGTRLPEHSLVPSELIMPGEDATLPEVRDMLDEKGLIPG